MALSPLDYESMTSLGRSVRRLGPHSHYVHTHGFRRQLSTIKPLDLKYDTYSAPDGSEGALVILHGLFGSKRNWQSLSKAFAKQSGRTVYALDLRNHGDSPHGEPMNYSAMAADVLHFCEQRSLTDVTLLGHSMGGKVAMSVALDPNRAEGLLSHLVIGDITPVQGRISAEFQRYIDGMLKIEEEGITSRNAAFKRLEEFEQDVTIRQFLLTSLATTAPHEPLKFRIPLQLISKSIPEIGWFPYMPGERSWVGKTLFVKGTQSNFIQDKHSDMMKKFFPNMQLKALDASHWLHAEKPKDFLDVVCQFIS